MILLYFHMFAAVHFVLVSEMHMQSASLDRDIRSSSKSSQSVSQPPNTARPSSASSRIPLHGQAPTRSFKRPSSARTNSFKPAPPQNPRCRPGSAKSPARVQKNIPQRAGARPKSAFVRRSTHISVPEADLGSVYNSSFLGIEGIEGKQSQSRPASAASMQGVQQSSDNALNLHVSDASPPAHESLLESQSQQASELEAMGLGSDGMHAFEVRETLVKIWEKQQPYRTARFFFFFFS